jgi:hypothetical protein
MHLQVAGGEPRSRKTEIGSWDRLEAEQVAVEAQRPFDVAYRE